MNAAPIFKKKIKFTRFLLFILILVFLILILRKAAIYIFFTIITGLFVYLNYHIRFPIDLSPVLFFSLIISREYSFWLSVIFIILSGIIPMIFAGGTFDHTTLFYAALVVFINFISSILSKQPLLYVLIPLIIIHHIIAGIGSITFGTNPYKELINFFSKIGIDLFYLTTLSDLVIGLIR
ncbi:MAG: hypothetical protein ABIJ34_03095 [archaeon]